jgi:hypothetical protein
VKEKTSLCRDLVGLRVQLVRTIKTRGGTTFRKGRVMLVSHTWRGGFYLAGLRETKGRGGSSRPGISQVPRSDFEVLPIMALIKSEDPTL